MTGIVFVIREYGSELGPIPDNKWVELVLLWLGSATSSTRFPIGVGAETAREPLRSWSSYPWPRDEHVVVESPVKRFDAFRCLLVTIALDARRRRLLSNRTSAGH
jgi:hypothetical protein